MCTGMCVCALSDVGVWLGLLEMGITVFHPCYFGATPCIYWSGGEGGMFIEMLVIFTKHPGSN